MLFKFHSLGMRESQWSLVNSFGAKANPCSELPGCHLIELVVVQKFTRTFFYRLHAVAGLNDLN